MNRWAGRARELLFILGLFALAFAAVASSVPEPALHMAVNDSDRHPSDLAALVKATASGAASSARVPR